MFLWSFLPSIESHIIFEKFTLSTVTIMLEKYSRSNAEYLHHVVFNLQLMVAVAQGVIVTYRDFVKDLTSWVRKSLVCPLEHYKVITFLNTDLIF